MPTKSILPQPSIRVPLCKRHFENYARKKISSQTVQDHIESPPKKKLEISKKDLEPVRRQPRRAAKDNHLLRLGCIKKRQSNEVQRSSKTKRRKIDNTTHDPDEWKLFLTSVEEQVRQATGQDRDTTPHKCPFGPTPWVCHSCTEEIGQKSKDDILTGTEPVAPVASMAAVGRAPKLDMWKEFGQGEVAEFKWRDMCYVIDVCREPMFMFIDRHLEFLLPAGYDSEGHDHSNTNTGDDSDIACDVGRLTTASSNGPQAKEDLGESRHAAGPDDEAKWLDRKG
ncbi:hypothetical protein F66182_5914 [Fusarium sp. NRRL 66182]|nr:hypothetical protein F66182_5914 [Fusarium sp. NRRL 66182]